MSHEERFRRKVTLVSTACAVLVVLLRFYSVPAIILLYIVISTIRWAINSNKK